MAANCLVYTKWNCKYHVVFEPKYRRLVIYEKKGNSRIYKKLIARR